MAPKSEAQRRMAQKVIDGTSKRIPLEVAQEIMEDDKGGKLPERLGKKKSKSRTRNSRRQRG